MKLKTLQKWLVVGLAEVLLSLLLFSIAPIFLNSNKPGLGFAIWFAVPSLLGGSGLYVARRTQQAQKARTLFLERFPEYRAIALTEFLEISPQRVRDGLELFEILQNDPDLATLHLTPFEWLKGIKSNER